MSAVHRRLKFLFVVKRLCCYRKSPTFFFSCSIASCVSITTISCSRFLSLTLPPLRYRNASLASYHFPCLTRMRGDSVAKVSKPRNKTAKTPAVICGELVSAATSMVCVSCAKRTSYYRRHRCCLHSSCNVMRGFRAARASIQCDPTRVFLDSR